MADWADVVTNAQALPGVEAAVSYGEPSLKVGRSLLTRLRQADQSIVLLDVVFEEREMLLAAEPELFFLEQHYRDYPIVLARLAPMELSRVQVLLERRWRNVAPRKLVRKHDAMKAGHRP